jgi:hypothetical protein
MRRVLRLCLLALVSLATTAEQAYGDDAAQQQDDAVGNDDGAQNYYYNNVQQSNGFFSAGSDYIKYWTDYAILPMRCIV